MLIIGLTGGIGSGKTVAANLFAELGVPIIDTDIIAREVVAPGQPALAEIRQQFGGKVITSDQQLDRNRLRQVVFDDPAKRKQLEAILHPRIQAEMLNRAKALDSPYCIFVIPLLLEAKQTHTVDRILVVDAPDEVRRQRVKSRDKISDQQIDQIFAAQLSREQRLAAADDIIHNDADELTYLRRQVLELNTLYLRLAAKD